MANDAVAFLVDWRDEDGAIIEYCEGVLQTGSLAAELIQADTAGGYEIFIYYLGRRVRVPLEYCVGDGHRSLCTLNDVLAPDYEVRWIVLSHGSDTLGFVALPTAAWRCLERQYPLGVAENFLDPRGLPNLCVDFVGDDFPQPAKSHWLRTLATAPRRPNEAGGESTGVAPTVDSPDDHSAAVKFLVARGTALLIALLTLSRERARDKNVPSPKELKVLEDQAEKDIREGRASDTVLIIHGIDPKEYRKQHPIGTARRHE